MFNAIRSVSSALLQKYKDFSTKIFPDGLSYEVIALTRPFRRGWRLV